jgi:hypothetical protein
MPKVIFHPNALQSLREAAEEDGVDQDKYIEELRQFFENHTEEELDAMSREVPLEEIPDEVLQEMGLKSPEKPN